MFKRLIYIFIIAFILNFVWENLHSSLYVHYQNKTITAAILAHAALFDAIFISFVSFLYFKIKPFKHNLFLVLLFSLAFAIGLETWALSIGRWAYTTNMPLVPFVDTGLTPTIQLALLALLSIVISRKIAGAHQY